ncbi:beta-CASP ribonuclease aCPSF1 [Haloferax volcanii]|jgi:KH/beta-lactamase-domain protein|uniref:Transcription termination factor FttA n=3 Tax=Haloferax TaxID=2251 RepID=A0A6C0UWT9_HALVO|nr:MULTISPECIES: beta-CASP ribonuclease aCPSF1 [Haloferax]ELK54402.1 mRNA 3-end processing factor-like protein [Haloferax sp. BAB-2207]ELZ72754.1 mRNA 3-end processing factor-like protein [Haloferax lucentense DSM 14919]NLV01808.1 beta-CASP ribonuclease aCPSF1 [Haloferax alexandrinus]QIB77418.1 beta-CASP ribonuclease aCPSF1 [Haloferax alexandrinus]RDZ32962.1 beta-CASP ribonuclease aCPSF1 [Haloferax sp. Atlit-48N]
MSSVDKQLENLKAEITNELPRDISVSDVKYEGPELVVYTRDPKKFAQNGDLIRKLASKLRKRITVRPDPDVLSDPREAEPKILSVIPEEAGVTDLDFHIDTGEVVIEAEKPGMVIGRHGSTLREITQKVGWTPEVVRTPPIESSTVSNVRNFLKQEREDRRRILERTGRQIHREQLSDDEWVRITTLGCCREVGRASFIVSTPETRILVDCGDKPGSDDVPYLQVPEALGSGANSLDAVVLTHAHLDHSALIPLLFKYGYDGPIYTTEPTRDLMGLLTLDYLDVASKEGRTPPYESEMVREAIKHTIPLEYGDVTDIAPDVKLTFHNAGHILGSAVSHFHIGDGLYNVAFSGDIHYEDTRLFNGAVNDFPRVETLVLESTYGGRNDYQTDQQDSEERLIEVINETYDRGGKVVIPAFAVGRSQEIMLVLEEAMRSGKIPEMPVHLDGMIWEATAIHTTYPEYLRDDLRDRIFHEDENPFLAEEFNHIDGGEEERQDVADGEQAIILSTSGMVTGGPIMSWLRHVGPDPKSRLVFVGYQAQGTLGRRIQNGWDEIPVNGRDGMGRSDTLKLKMDVETVDGFSGHADRQGLENFVKTMNPRPEKVLCVHGDERSVQDLSSALYHDYNMRTFAPKNLETFRFK